MKTKFWLAAVALSATLFFVASCKKDDNNNNDNKPTLNASDIDFLTRFSQANRSIMTLSELARDSGTDAGVKSYAQMVMRDYQIGQRSLDSIAIAYNITLPTTADTATIAYLSRLRSTTRGTRFDSSFISNQLTIHDATLVDLNKGSSQATNAKLKNYVNLQIPVVTRYRTMADSLSKKF